MKKFLLMMVVAIMLVSCTSTKYISPTLPNFSIPKPNRPTLLEIKDELPVEATINLINLVGHIEKLEIVIDGWENFYRGLKENETI